MRQTTIARAAALLVLFTSMLLQACSGKDADPDPRSIEPDYSCPGAENCPDRGEAVLMAGAAAAVINPDIIDTIDDLNGNGDFEPHEGDVWHDNNENGEWDFTWLAGYGTARPANDILHDLWTRAVVLRWKSTTVAVVSLDLVGYFWDDVMDIREDVADLDIDFVVVAATHNHEAPDVIGIWGFVDSVIGWDQAYIDRVRQTTEQTIRDAYDAMVPARAAFGTAVPDGGGRGVCNVVLDGRDPFILIEDLTTLRLTDAADDSTIATIINWTGHPESAGDENHSITSDYPHFLREGVEKGIHRGSTDREGVGGVALFVNGALGCQIGHPHRVTCTDLEGAVWEPGNEEVFGKVQCIGENLAVAALDAIAGETEPLDEVPLEFRVKSVFLQVENYAYQAMIYNDVFHIHRRDYGGFDRLRPITEDNMPSFDTEISWIRIGPAQAITMPGEVAPELLIGGYDGSRTPECAYDWRIERGTLCSTDNENPPDLSRAPGPPYLFDFMNERGSQYTMVWGTTDDFLGYFIPSYDYQLAEQGAYIEEAPGHHYEETNSIGPSGWPELERNFVGILVYEP
jgi:hypothetical protein